MKKIVLSLAVLTLYLLAHQGDVAAQETTTIQIAGYWIIDNREAPMARKPNYKFEKLERERQKAAKKQAKKAAGLHP